MSSDVPDLLRLHLALECIGLTAGGDLCRIPGAEPDEIPRLYIARRAAGCSVFFSERLPQAIREPLRALNAEQLASDHDLVQSILAEHFPCERVHDGVSHVAPSGFAAAEAAGAVLLDEADRPLFEEVERQPTHLELGVLAVLVEGRVAAYCASAREDRRAAEAWVFTAPSHRRKGFARRAVAAWAKHRSDQGKVTFYSHRRDNTASRKLAQSLSHREYLSDVGYF